jgi:hypothetical protein
MEFSTANRVFSNRNGGTLAMRLAADQFITFLDGITLSTMSGKSALSVSSDW